MLLCSNMLALVPDGGLHDRLANGEQPRSRIVGPKLLYMDERIAVIDLVVSKLVRCDFPASSLRVVCLSSQHLTLIVVEKAISEDELNHRRHGSPARRRAQSQGMALGLLRANVDYLAHGKVRCVDLKHHFTL